MTDLEGKAVEAADRFLASARRATTDHALIGAYVGACGRAMVAGAMVELGLSLDRLANATDMPAWREVL